MELVQLFFLLGRILGVHPHESGYELGVLPIYEVEVSGNGRTHSYHLFKDWNFHQSNKPFSYGGTHIYRNFQVQ